MGTCFYRSHSVRSIICSYSVSLHLFQYIAIFPDIWDVRSSPAGTIPPLTPSRAGFDNTDSQNSIFIFAKVDQRLTSNTGRNISDSFVLPYVTWSLSLRWHPLGVEREEIGLQLTLKKRKSSWTQNCLFRFCRHGDLEELKISLKIWWSNKLRVWTIPEGCPLQRDDVWQLQLQQNNSGCENFRLSNRRYSIRYNRKKNKTSWN